MRLYLIGAVTIAVSCLYLGILGLRGKTRRTTRRLFFLMCCSMAWFLLAAGVSVSSTHKHEVELWYRLSAFGFAPFYAINLHFYLSLLRPGRPEPRDYMLYLPVPLVLVSSLLSSSLFRDFVAAGAWWRFSPAYDSPWFWLYCCYYLSFTGSTAALLFLRSARSGLRTERLQAVFISAFSTATLLFGSVADFVLTGLPHYSLPPLGPLIVGVYIFGLWFVVMRYGFMEPSPGFVSDEILDNIHEMVFVLDASLRVVQANSWSRSLLGLKADVEELPRFPALTQRPPEVEQALRGLCESTQAFTFRRIEYGSTPRPIIADSYLSRIRNSLNDVLGYVVISRQNVGLQELIRAYAISRREAEVLICCVAGSTNRQIASALGIAERTVETHLSHIFNKTATNGKIELYGLASQYGLRSGV